MSTLRMLALGLLLLTATIPAYATTQPSALPQAPIVVDHNSVALFEQIPENYLLAAQATSMLYMDRSVGGNISVGLDCLSYPDRRVGQESLCALYACGPRLLGEPRRPELESPRRL